MEISLEQWENWDIISIDGQLVLTFLNRAREFFDKYRMKSSTNVALNLENTSFLDSSAIILLTNFKNEIEENGGTIVLFGPNNEVQDIFSIINIEKVFTIYKNREVFENSSKT